MKLFTQLVAALSVCLLAICQVAAQTPTAAAASTNANYTIVCTRVLRPGIDFRIGVALFTRSTGHGIKSATARLNTTQKGGKFAVVKAETNWKPKAGEVKSDIELTLKVSGGPKDFDPVGRYKLDVTLEDTLGNRYSNSTDVTLTFPSVTTLIQTDKAVYKPGQLVKFRIVNVDESLTPVLTDLEVQIKDARSNLVDKQIHNLTALKSWSDKAVMTGEFQLSDMPNEGDWTITAVSEYGTEVKSFNVRQYVLPKFSLDLTVPSFVHFNDSEFTVRAKVRYTFDKAVEGTFNATIGPDMNCKYCKDRYDQLDTFAVEAQSDGSANFTFNMAKWRKSLVTRRLEYYPGVYSARAAVQFREKFTGEIKMAESTFSIYMKRYELKIDASQVPFFLPGFDIPVKISLVRPDGQPFTGRASSDVTVSITYQQRAKKRVLEVHRGPLSAADSGTGASLMVTIPSHADFHPVQIEARITGDDNMTLHAFTSVHPFIAVTNDYVKLSLKTVRDDIEVELVKSAGILTDNVYYIVLSRGQLQKWGKFSDAKLKFTKTELVNYVTDVTVVSFGVDSTGEIVGSVAKHEMTRFGGNVSLKSNLTEDKGEPQQWASVRVAADPQSFVFLTGIDASVNLLATGQDILQSSLAEKYKSRVLGSRYWPRPQRLTTGKILSENGLVVLSDAFYYTEHEARISYSTNARGRSMLGVGAEYDAVPAPMAMAMKSSATNAGGTMQVRKFFPETMVWTVVQTDSEGRASHAFLLPDTVTSWDLTGFGVAAGKQIQTMDAAFKVTTFKNFFARPVLPYSLVRGEKFLLKVLVFNYRGTDGKVAVTLNFTAADADAKVATGQSGAVPVAGAPQLPSVEVPVPANSAGMALFELTPRGLPSLELTVRATYTESSYSETDVVVKSVIVVPEGRTEYRSRSVLLSPPGSGSRPTQNVSIEFPVTSADLVNGSEVFSYSIIGDVMGPAMQNIGSLLRLPSGCGEQNMVNFAPAVFIWEYLSGTGQQTDELKETALRVMKVGLQRQLTYKRLDGSYSAFGEQDEAGSVWLTAFVLSVYARAASFITIEPEALTGKSVKFLLDRQSGNGQFTEPPGARVLDSSLQGSSTKASQGMTAFICLALLDVDEVTRAKPSMQATLWKDLDVKGSITKCLWYVKSAFDSKPGAFSSYDVALSAFLLRRAQATTTYRQASLQRGLDAIMTAINAQAETAPDGGKFWSTTDTWGRKSGSVEATAWALLGFTLTGNTDESLQILRWLSNRQTSAGGFQTSQATVVGIRALSAFAAKSGLASGDAEVEVAVGGKTNVHAVPNSRRLVLTQGRLLRGSGARVDNAVVRHKSGSGFALVTLSWQFNLLDKRPLSAEWKSASGLGIRLDVPSDPKPLPAGQFRLGVCARANSSEGMLILRVTNPSGFSASRLPQTSDVFGLKRVEPGPQEVVMYFDYITAEGICVAITWTREVPVLDLSPQLISLQKYYSTDQAVSASYLAPELKSLTQCKACPECPSCKPKASWLAWLV